MSTRKKTKKFSDGNVGAEEVRSRGIGNIKCWVETSSRANPDPYKHPLFLTRDEADRLYECLGDLLDALDGEVA